MTVRFGRWFLSWNRDGSWAAKSNGEGHYDFRGRKFLLTKITIGV